MSDRENTQAAERGPAPFDLTFTPALPELLRKLDVTIAITTYQAGKLVLISPVNDERLVQLPRTYPRAMALGVHDRSLAVATVGSVELLARDERLAPAYPRQQNTYDTIYLPRTSYHTGRIDCHGLEWGNAGLWAVNTRFSALCTLSEEYGFVPRWKPKWVTELLPQDRCHLNGVAMESGEPRYVTCLNTGNEYESWKKTIPDGGVVVDVTTEEIVSTDLPMPHSPRLINGTLYVLLSSTGELATIDLSNGTHRTVVSFGGFVRGMAHHRDHLFIAMSKIRKNSSSFRKLAIADSSTKAGIAVVHQPTGTLVGRITYEQSVDEIFDVAVLPGLRRPGIVSTDTAVHRHAFSFPEGAMWVVPKKGDDEKKEPNKPNRNE